MKKVLTVLTVCFLAISLFAYFLQKDSPRQKIDPIQKNRTEIYKVIDDPKLNATNDGKITIAIFRTMTCTLLGEACTSTPSDGNKNFNKSITGYATGLIMIPFTNPPASGVMWAYSGLENAGFIPKSYAAQGIGLASITPLSGIWKVLRDVAYILLVLVLIAFGFMIMFRLKINPQTVITIENSLPRIVLALILITFSFAIAGFLIDLMYVVIAIIVSILAPAAGLDIRALQNRYIEAGPGEIFNSLMRQKTTGPWNIFWTLPNALLGIVPLIGILARLVGSIVGLFYVFPWMVNALGKILTNIFDIKPGGEGTLGIDFILKAGGTAKATWGGIGKAISQGVALPAFLAISVALGMFIVVPLIFGLLLFTALVIIFFRIFFMLLTAYIKIIFLIIVSPIYLLQLTLPGRSPFSGWIKSLISELMVFPLVVGIFIVAVIITNNAAGGEFFRLPFLYGLDAGSFATVLSMYILYSTPNLVGAVRKILAPKQQAQLPGLGVFFGGMGAGLSAAQSKLQGYALMAPYFPTLRKIMGLIPGYKFGTQEGKKEPTEIFSLGKK